MLASGQDPTKELVQQRAEPDRFCKLFKDFIIVHKGKRRDQIRMASKVPPDTRVYHIRQTNRTIRGIQASNDSTILNTKDLFLVLPKSTSGEQATAHLWAGKQSNPDIIHLISARFLKTPHVPPKSITTIKEHEETEAFWQLWENHKPEIYQDIAFYQTYSNPKLFRCSTKTGDFKVDLINPFGVNDIGSRDETYFLDTGCELYYLSGANCAESEKKLARKTILDYLEKVKELRSFEIKAFDISDDPLPPTSFTRHFHAWSIKESKLDPRQM